MEGGGKIQPEEAQDCPGHAAARTVKVQNIFEGTLDTGIQNGGEYDNPGKQSKNFTKNSM